MPPVRAGIRVPLTRRPVTRTLAALGVMVSATSVRTGAQVPVRADGARVLVSATEVRVYFPHDTLRRWGWPNDRFLDFLPRYSWRLDIEAIGAPRSLSLKVGRGDSPPRSFTTLHGVVAAGKTGLCDTQMFEKCNALGTSATVDRDQVVVIYRNAKQMRRLFGLRPDSLMIQQTAPPGDPRRRYQWVPVHYVDPQLALPDSAFRAEAARAARAYEAGTRSIWHEISDGRIRTGLELTMAVGDSFPIHIETRFCSGDICSQSSSSPPDAKWSVKDTTIARVRSLASVNRSGYVFDDPRIMIVGVAPGRTKIRVKLGLSSLDTLSSRPPERDVERVVIVSKP